MVYRMPAPWATVVLTVVGIVAGTVLAGLPPLIRQGSDLREQLPQYMREVVDNNPTLLDLDQRIGPGAAGRGVASGEGSGVLDEQPPEVLLGVAMGVVRSVLRC